MLRVALGAPSGTMLAGVALLVSGDMSQVYFICFSCLKKPVGEAYPSHPCVLHAQRVPRTSQADLKYPFYTATATALLSAYYGVRR